MKIYIVNTKYVDYLRESDPKVLVNEEDGKIRKYVGIVLEINKFNYFVPLSSPKDSDYIFINSIKTVRKTNVPIHRIIVLDGDKENFFGKLKFSSMIPVPDNQIALLDVNNIKNRSYKSIIENQIRYIRKNKGSLKKNKSLLAQWC